jgi:GNAT superfamily N-acetyltransferase
MGGQGDTGTAAPITVDDVVFTEATPRQRILSWKLNGTSWAPPMAIEQYVVRETVLSQTALSANGGTKYYVLHHKSDPELIVSACEVTAKQGLVADKNGSREVTAYSIASVFTNPRFRGHGMASHMLRHVQQVVDEAGAEYGALYSDIGRVFYTRLGWQDLRSPQVLFHLRDDLRIPPEAVTGVNHLAEETVASLCEQEVATWRQRFRRIAQQRQQQNISSSNTTHIIFLPTPAQLSWHFARDKYVCKTLLDREVVHRGAQTADGKAWICWDHDLREKKLKILKFVVGVGEDEPPAKKRVDAVKLLLAAMAEAKEWGLPKVLVWIPAGSHLGQGGPEWEWATAAATDIWREWGPLVQVVLEEREDGSIPSLRWRGGESLEGVIWEDSEYYAWC